MIGGGPAGLMAAEVLARAGVRVTIYDQMPSLGRKFLLAGRGGLNLTHSEDLGAFLGRYGEAPPLLRQAIETLSALRACAPGAKTWGSRPSSARADGYFRKASRPPRCYARGCGGLSELGVNVRLRHRWQGWDAEGRLRFVSGGEESL